MRNEVEKRDIYAGVLLCAIGLIVVYQALQHAIGTLDRVQAGFFPFILGLMLTGLGILIGAKACLVPSDASGDSIHPPDLRGCAAIVASVIAFVVIGRFWGLVPATFVSTLVAAAGDRQMSLKGAVVLATALVVVAATLFSYALKVPFPLFGW